MNKHDKAMQLYFSKRSAPPPALQEQLKQKLIEAEAQENTVNKGSPRLIWSVLLYDFLISSAIIFGLWILFGPHLLVYAITIFTVLSLLAAVVISLARFVEGGTLCFGSLQE